MFSYMKLTPSMKPPHLEFRLVRFYEAQRASVSSVSQGHWVFILVVKEV